MSLEFEHKGLTYTVCIHGETTVGTAFKANVWNNKGQLVDTFIIIANTANEAVGRIVNS